MIQAALYLRSSKDRSDVSIAAQRHELTTLAAARGMVIAREYTDVVESAKDEHRPGFQALLLDLKSPQRGWQALLMVDTSRLSRRRYMAQVFKHEARKQGVQIIFSKLPESDPIVDLVVEGVMEVFDELHSLMSREKGLAGMAENIRQGYRAGGRAPWGYRLQAVTTGAVREGEPVCKTRLAPSDDARKAQAYLAARAAGTARAQAAREAGIDMAVSSLIGIEWNALTYAGHSVWNVHSRKVEGGYEGGRKRRPRAEWVIEEGTHEALISTEQAEAILARLERYSAANPRRRGGHRYLLTGLLVTPQGERWQGDGARGYYRCSARRVKAQAVEQAVMSTVVADIASPAFIAALVGSAREQAAEGTAGEVKRLQAELRTTDSQIERFLDMAGQLDTPAPVLRRIERLEQQRRQAQADLAEAEREARLRRTMSEITEAQAAELLAALAEGLGAAAEPARRDMVHALVERIELHPDTLVASLHYRIALDSGVRVASPRERQLIPTLRAVSQALVEGRRRQS